MWRLDVIDKKIFITCPVAGVPVKTGLRTPTGTDLTGLKRVTMLHCPACRDEHIWNEEDAFWEGDEPDPTFRDVVWSIWRRSKRA
jgi:hypothetical protein